jgi:hypothetical protein
LNSSSSPLANCNPTPNKLYINAINRNSSCDHSTYSTGCMYILYQYTVELYCLELGTKWTSISKEYLKISKRYPEAVVFEIFLKDYIFLRQRSMISV